MKYAREVIELMGAYPGRDFRMREMVNAIAGKKACDKERKQIRIGLTFIPTVTTVPDGSIPMRKNASQAVRGYGSG